MNGASKILTVSYGTFSCTLEGFDDPFNTMKAIAEYFRDLAAGDRYFGAEPPTPDAAMLHQIAEREIQRRVEAKIQENGVVLRASEQSEPTAPQVQAPAPVADAPAPRVVMPAVAAAAPVAAAPSLAPANAPSAESVVEKLSRLRSEIAAQPVSAPPLQSVPVVSLTIPDYAEDQEAEALDAAALADFLPEDSGEAAAEDATALPEDTALDAPVEEMRTEAPMQPEEGATAAVAVVAAEAAVDEPAEEAEVDLAAVMEHASIEAAAPEAETEAEVAAEADDMPESLRAVLAEVSEAEIAPEVVAAPEAGVSDDALAVDAFETPFEDAPAEADLPEAAFAELEPEVAEEDLTTASAPAVEEVAAEDAHSIWAEAELAGEEAAEFASAADAEGKPDAPDVVTGDLSGNTGPTAGEALDADLDDDLQKPAAEAAAEPASEPATGIELRPGAAEKLQRARARVIRIRKGDDAAAVAAQPVASPAAPEATRDAAPQTTPEAAKAEAVVEAEVEAAQEMAPASGDAPLLSPEDEAELQRELAALRRSEEERDAAEAAALEQQTEARRGFDGPSADEALGRLMQQTDSEMEGTETKRRQSAIQHLKAAVAATVADRKVTGDKSGEAETVSRLARYRNDLAMAVKAALPGRGGAAAPQGERPAPLVLVSEQRIDRPRTTGGPSAAAAPIRPRRVTSAGMGMATATDLDLSDEDDEEDDLANVFDDSKGFAEFVERVGAHGFEQILEASAAYIAGVEGRPHFSRPQLMRHLTAVIPQGSFQREDSLRSFGTLLRDGRIAKVRRGQFTLTEESAYLAEARKLAQ